jgi:hypothetical protein
LARTASWKHDESGVDVEHDVDCLIETDVPIYGRRASKLTFLIWG